MIQVDNLTKRYGLVEAIHDVSFSVDKGRIVGFLGPNGAGKSTTMKILSCFMPASGGTATVAGFDVFSQSLEVRRRRLQAALRGIPVLPEALAQGPARRRRRFRRGGRGSRVRHPAGRVAGSAEGDRNHAAGSHVGLRRRARLCVGPDGCRRGRSIRGERLPGHPVGLPLAFR